MDEKKNNSVTIILMIILVCIAGYFIYENLLLSDVAKLERQAKKGDVNAQFELGKMYDHGSGVKEDKKSRWNGIYLLPNKVMVQLKIVSVSLIFWEKV